MFVYWLYDVTCSMPQTEGYVGITSDYVLRMKQHRKRPGIGREHTGFQSAIIFEGTKKECREIEYDMRPHLGIGRNTYPGGMTGFYGKHTDETKALLREKRFEAS